MKNAKDFKEVVLDYVGSVKPYRKLFKDSKHPKKLFTVQDQSGQCHSVILNQFGELRVSKCFKNSEAIPYSELVK